jgi:hypothetical protein
MKQPTGWSLLFTVLLFTAVEAFFIAAPSRTSRSSKPSLLVVRLGGGFFRDLFKEAFENDASLSQEELREGAIEGPLDDVSTERKKTPLTETQERWRQTVHSSSDQATDDTVCGTEAEMEFYLAGIPNKDPSNDLFGASVSISSRDRKVGLPLPEKPTLAATVRFLPDNKCAVTESNESRFFGDERGDWKLSDDGKQIRFRLAVTGYRRTIETTGTIQNVYWTAEKERTKRTSTTYEIPPGWMYGEADVSRAKKDTLQWGDSGLLKVERPAGLLGIATKMIPCGRFLAGRTRVVAAAAAKTPAPRAVQEEAVEKVE